MMIFARFLLPVIRFILLLRSSLVSPGAAFKSSFGLYFFFGLVTIREVRRGLVGLEAGRFAFAVALEELAVSAPLALAVVAVAVTLAGLRAKYCCMTPRTRDSALTHWSLPMWISS